MRPSSTSCRVAIEPSPHHQRPTPFVFGASPPAHPMLLHPSPVSASSPAAPAYAFRPPTIFALRMLPSTITPTRASRRPPVATQRHLIAQLANILRALGGAAAGVRGVTEPQTSCSHCPWTCRAEKGYANTAGYGEGWEWEQEARDVGGEGQGRGRGSRTGSRHGQTEAECNCVICAEQRAPSPHIELMCVASVTRCKLTSSDIDTKARTCRKSGVPPRRLQPHLCDRRREWRQKPKPARATRGPALARWSHSLAGLASGLEPEPGQHCTPLPRPAVSCVSPCAARLAAEAGSPARSEHERYQHARLRGRILRRHVDARAPAVFQRLRV
jgi:hypothetical protein